MWRAWIWPASAARPRCGGWRRRSRAGRGRAASSAFHVLEPGGASPPRADDGFLLMRPMNACIAPGFPHCGVRDTRNRTHQVKEVGVPACFGVLASNRTATNVSFPPIASVQPTVDGPCGAPHLPEEVFMAGPALAADAGPDAPSSRSSTAPDARTLDGSPRARPF